MKVNNEILVGCLLPIRVRVIGGCGLRRYFVHFVYVISHEGNEWH